MEETRSRSISRVTALAASTCDEFDGTADDCGEERVRELDALKLKLSAEGVVAGERKIDADADGVRGGRGGEETECENEGGGRPECFHGMPPKKKT